ncbi:hypothetical protein [Gracilibacillus sp. YIM 98692]|uniref:hypothetical protein n=1 Tax=Gracilibacillus sp. YIM 98692 TaxID=2663532 RepID=UPI0013D83A15|nr:hypothetical protein [Gracilibacillus sp. YIM 98692]
MKQLDLFGEESNLPHKRDHPATITLDVGKRVKVRDVTEVEGNALSIEDYYYLLPFRNRKGVIESKRQNIQKNLYTYVVAFDTDVKGCFYGADLITL